LEKEKEKEKKNKKEFATIRMYVSNCKNDKKYYLMK